MTEVSAARTDDAHLFAHLSSDMRQPLLTVEAQSLQAPVP